VIQSPMSRFIFILTAETKNTGRHIVFDDTMRSSTDTASFDKHSTDDSLRLLTAHLKVRGIVRNIDELLFHLQARRYQAACGDRNISLILPVGYETVS